MIFLYDFHDKRFNDIPIENTLKLINRKWIIVLIRDMFSGKNTFVMLESVQEVDWETESKLLNYFSIEELHILKFLLKKIIITIEDIQK